MPSVFVSSLIAFGFGALLAGLIIFLVLRHRLERAGLSRDANELVQQNKLDSKQLEIENLNRQMQEIKERLTAKESALQSAVVSEAEMKATLTQQQKQNAEKLALLDQARERLGLEFKNIDRKSTRLNSSH